MLSIVIPVYNEEESVTAVVTDVLGKLPEGWELLIVDDGSTDGTAERLKAFSQDGRLRLLHHLNNRGYGAALKTGIRHASSPLVAFLDCDGQHRFEDLCRLADCAVKNGYDLVVGARKGFARQNVMRQPGKWLLGKLANYLAGVKIPDLNSGLRVIKKEIVEDIGHFLPDGFSFSTTSTMACIQAGYSIEYLPIQPLPRKGSSKVRLKDALSTVVLMLRLVMVFSPLKVFGPIAFFLFLFSLPMVVWDLRDLNFREGTILLLLTGWITVAFGLLADQIAAIRRESRHGLGIRP